MKAGELNDWLGVITNIGVIAGLALLVYELSLTNRAVDLTFDEWRGSIAFDTNEMMSRVPLVLAEDPEMADIWDRASRGEELLGADRVRFDRLVTLHFYTRLQLYNVWLARDKDADVAFIAEEHWAEMEDAPGLQKEWRKWVIRYGIKKGYVEFMENALHEK